MGTYTFEKQSNGQIHRFRNGDFQETVTNSEFQLLERIAELEAHYTHLFNAACDNCYREEGDGHGAVHTEIPEWLGNFSKGEKYETPAQSLAHIKRETIETAHQIVMSSHGIDVEALRLYAEQLTKEIE